MEQLVPSYHNQKIVPYSVQQMFDLVWDIEGYPLFLPWISKAKVHKLEKNHIVADLAIGYRSFTKTYRSQVRSIVPQNKSLSSEINVQAEPGLFKHLHNNWQFTPQNRGCLVKFEIDFIIKSPLLQKAFNSIFEQTTIEIIYYFTRRAKERFTIESLQIIIFISLNI